MRSVFMTNDKPDSCRFLRIGINYDFVLANISIFLFTQEAFVKCFTVNQGLHLIKNVKCYN